jgi:Ran GTPase-activating protein (RanGAP) involved in mRNA processing and transport
MDTIDKPCEDIVSLIDSGINKLNDDILCYILVMLFSSSDSDFIDDSDFIRYYKIISEINKQFNIIVLNIIPKLTQINLYNNNFCTYQESNKLDEILKKTKNITTLEFKRSSINYKVLISLVAFLKNNTTLTTVRFEKLRDSNWDYVANWDYNINSEIEKEKLLKALLINTTLLELDLSYMQIDEVFGIFKLIKEALKTNKTLTKLSLHGNRLCDYGGFTIAEALKHNNTLKTLDLTDTHIKEQGTKSIGKTLEINKTLTKLSYAFNCCYTEGAKAIAKALKHNSTLITLELSYSSIDTNAVITIAEALKTNTTLTLLDFRSHYSGDTGAKAIAEAVKINTTLTLLDFRSDTISVDGEKAIREALEINTTIQIITS